MSKAIKRVVIVGGGSAGWLTAGVIAGHFDTEADAGIEVTLIESPDIKPIGVGEGTWPSMRTTLQKIGISETDFMRECDVSLKQGSRFNGWRNGGNDYYYHPFSLPGGFADINLADYWQSMRAQISFTDAVSPQGQLCNRGLAAKQIATPEYAFNVNYGYHLDAGKFSDFLQRHCITKLGVKHVLDHIVGVNVADNDDIKSLQTRENRELLGDLFVDCTGFAALLIDKHYAVPFNGMKDVLFNDTALAMQVPYLHEDDPITSYTLSTAQSAGWIWDIGLPTRRGVGYVYSGSHIADDVAEAELRQYVIKIVGQAEADKLATRKISINPGYRQKFWYKNCVAVGLSAGFVEPLEASALVLIEMSAKMIVEQFPANRAVMDVVANRFNQKFTYRWQQVIDFLKLHYVLTQRQESDYWLDNCDFDSIPSSLQESLALWRYQAPWHQDAPNIDELFSSASFQYVLYGMGFETEVSASTLRAESQLRNHANKLFRDNRAKTDKLLRVLPTNRELIKKVREFGFQKM